ncbi:MAG: hypothetical protein IPL27_04565 [Lewinellaceae bacterium]|nr:hypothetical protein [Lewinellaceae bacterium]
MQVFDDETKDNDWDALWSVKSKVLENGWSAEFAIPFKSLRYGIAKGGRGGFLRLYGCSFGAQNLRADRFPPIPQAFSPYRMTYAARLEGLELPKPALNLRLNPYFLYNSEKRTVNSNENPRGE